MNIRQSARKHGVEDADMLHVIQDPRSVWFPVAANDGDEGHMVIGLDRAGNRLLEILVLDLNTTDERIIHAQKATKHYIRRLP